MKGDFSRLVFDPDKQYTRVLMQQGRVQLDADWNEQAAILLHYLERLAADLIGPFGGPKDDLGFAIAPVVENDEISKLTIGKGRYYVDGLLCENPQDYDWLPTDGFPDLPLLVYLDVWERHVTYIEDGSIREVALGGPDTATRAQVVWKMCVTNEQPDGNRIENTLEGASVWENWNSWVSLGQPPNRGLLKARARGDEEATDPCLASPDARYRGPENQLYRVEIHTGSKAKKGSEAKVVTFKWSRDNGSVVFPILSYGLDGELATVRLEHLGHGGRLALAPGDRVELVYVGGWKEDEPGDLLEVVEVDADRRQVKLKGASSSQAGDRDPTPLLLRRWDHGRMKGLAGDGAVQVQEGEKEEEWLHLEDGIQICFDNPRAQYYRTGDYWLIPARTATGDVDWPRSAEKPESCPPHGVRHHYAPLALLLTGRDTITITDLRKEIAIVAGPVKG